MRRFKLALAASLAVAAFLASSAGSHLAFCGHWDKVYNYGRAKADYWYWSQNGPDHFHYYTHRTRVKLPNGKWSRWRARHTYFRKCNGVVR